MKFRFVLAYPLTSLNAQIEANFSLCSLWSTMLLMQSTNLNDCAKCGLQRSPHRGWPNSGLNRLWKSTQNVATGWPHPFSALTRSRCQTCQGQLAVGHPSGLTTHNPSILNKSQMKVSGPFHSNVNMPTNTPKTQMWGEKLCKEMRCLSQVCLHLQCQTRGHQGDFNTNGNSSTYQSVLLFQLMPGSGPFFG